MVKVKIKGIQLKKQEEAIFWTTWCTEFELYPESYGKLLKHFQWEVNDIICSLERSFYNNVEDTKEGWIDSRKTS